MRRRCTVPSHCPSLLAICANCRFFRMPCWCLAHSHPHPGSLHDNDRGCFQCPQFGHRTCDGGLTWGFPPDPAPPPSPSPLDPRAAVARRSIDARPTVGRDGALARSSRIQHHVFNTTWKKFGPSEESEVRVRGPAVRHTSCDSGALASSCAFSPPPVTPRARAANRSTGRAREGTGDQSQHGRRRHVARCAPVAPFPGALSPRSRHRRRRPETKGGIPLSAGRDPSHGR